MKYLLLREVLLVIADYIGLYGIYSCIYLEEERGRNKGNH